MRGVESKDREVEKSVEERGVGDDGLRCNAVDHDNVGDGGELSDEEEEIFVANPNKPREIKVILAKNHERLLELLNNLSVGKCGDDDQFEEEKELIIKEIQRVSQLPNLDS